MMHQQIQHYADSVYAKNLHCLNVQGMEFSWIISTFILLKGQL